ncbi:BTAD domain-containing putative transcriptional regulator [Pelagibius marinus]|uniref:BTAD domain-containing putative transcriptional regulator n=1 Tax=Pelagibius marinus TaxID=2762760 RepID=UPI001872CF5B|nr:BTAD domain-containing putative transcriptional regulator [Pelagibius marinus]
MKPLRFTLLGGFQVRDTAGTEIAISGTKVALLLAYLALRPGQDHSRDKLINLLWSDRAEEQARASLRQAIWALRRALGDSASSPLVVTSASLCLNKDQIETDVGDIERLVAENSVSSLRSATGLYRGRLLEGLRVRDPAFDAFLRDEGTRIHDLVVSACTRLLETQRSEPAGAEGAKLAKALLELDPLQEAAHRYLIWHLAQRGEIGLAARQYRECCDVLRRELDLDPSAETQAAFEEAKQSQAPDGGTDEGQLDKPFLTAWEKPKIAVLPFLNLSGDPLQEYFSDGVTEEIIAALALWRSFPVISSSSSFAFKGRAVDVKQVGRDLDARYVLEGSIRKSGTEVRVTAQLIDTASGHHVWVEKFNRHLEDVFSLQDEIAGRIAATLEPAMGNVELNRSRREHPVNLDAWDFCLRGKAYLRSWTENDTVMARRMFEKAVELDPGYSEAFADLAWTHSRDLLMEWSEDREHSIERMHAAAKRAVELDDSSSLAHYRLSTAYLWRNEHELAIAEGRQAVELNPMSADALHALGNKIDLAGDPDGIPMMERALMLSPLHPQRNMQLTFLARAYLNIHQYEKATETAREAIQRQPDYPHAYYILAAALGHLEDKESAGVALAKCEEVHPGFVERRSGWAPYLKPESNAHLHEGLHKAGVQDRARTESRNDPAQRHNIS